MDLGYLASQFWTEYSYLLENTFKLKSRNLDLGTFVTAVRLLKG